MLRTALSKLQRARAIVLRSHSSNPLVNLALEELVLAFPTRPSRVLILWRSEPCVVVGRNQNLLAETNVPRAIADGIRLIRRRSGGGTVYHDKGTSVFASVCPQNVFHRDHAAHIICRALHSIGIPAANVSQRHDVMVNDRKVSGSAYRLTGGSAYHHGTMLLNSNLDSLRTYLRSPWRTEIIAKGVASVPSPVANLIDFCPVIDHTLFCNAVARYYKLDILGIDHTSQTESGLLDPEFEEDDPRAGPLLRDISQQIETIDIFEDDIMQIPEIQSQIDELKTKSWLFEQQPWFTHEINFVGTDYKFNLKITTSQGKVTETTGPGFQCSNPSIDDQFIKQLNLDALSRLLAQIYEPKIIFDSYATMRWKSNFPSQLTKSYRIFLDNLLDKVY